MAADHFDYIDLGLCLGIDEGILALYGAIYIFRFSVQHRGNHFTDCALAVKNRSPSQKIHKTYCRRRLTANIGCISARHVWSDVRRRREIIRYPIFHATFQQSVSHKVFR